MIKLQIAASARGVAAAEGPVHLYLINDELSVTEVKEAIEANGPLGRSDRVAQERAERAVFLIGTFPAETPSTENEGIHGRDGQDGIVERTIRWTFSDAQGWSLGVFNQTGAAMTTGATVRFVAKFFGVWLM